MTASGCHVAHLTRPAAALDHAPEAHVETPTPFMDDIGEAKVAAQSQTLARVTGPTASSYPSSSKAATHTSSTART
jgi:hypothetical protein